LGVAVARTFIRQASLFCDKRNTSKEQKEAIMGFGKGALLWLLGIPLPIIILLAIFMHH
jgi:hypothetical protein